MFHSFSARNLVFLILVLGSWLSLASCDDPEPESEAVTESEQEASEEVHDTSAHDALHECEHPGNDTKEKCCRMNIDIDDVLMKCYILHQKKMPGKNEQNPTVLAKYFSCLIECIYKAKKYIAKHDTLNMKMIKSDARKLYKNDEKQQEFMIEMYEHCERTAASAYSTVKKNVGGRIILNGTCKPYYMFVFLCVADYGKISCPYFRWKGQKESEEICKDLKMQCEKLHV